MSNRKERRQKQNLEKEQKSGEKTNAWIESYLKKELRKIIFAGTKYTTEVYKSPQKIIEEFIKNSKLDPSKFCKMCGNFLDNCSGHPKRGSLNDPRMSGAGYAPVTLNEVGYDPIDRRPWLILDDCSSNYRENVDLEKREKLLEEAVSNFLPIVKNLLQYFPKEIACLICIYFLDTKYFIREQTQWVLEKLEIWIKYYNSCILPIENQKSAVAVIGEIYKLSGIERKIVSLIDIIDFEHADINDLDKLLRLLQVPCIGLLNRKITSQNKKTKHIQLFIMTKLSNADLKKYRHSWLHSDLLKNYTVTLETYKDPKPFAPKFRSVSILSNRLPPIPLPKPIRGQYPTIGTYNADFDGDETPFLN